jgi:hypothetical protein
MRLKNPKTILLVQASSLIFSRFIALNANEKISFLRRSPLPEFLDGLETADTCHLQEVMPFRGAELV